MQLRKGLILLVALLLFAGLMIGCDSSETGEGTGTPADGSAEQKLQGEGQGANPDVPIKVEVTMVDGKITAIEILSHEESDGEAIFEQVTAAIIAAQSTDVDVIPGAEKTSEGIMEAVANATGM